MASTTSASLDKLTCTNYVDFGKCHDKFGRFLWYKKDSNYLDIKVKVFNRAENRGFCLGQNLTMGEADFERFIRLSIRLVIAAENFGREENLLLVLIPTMSKDKDEQLKLAQKLIDVVDQANRKACVTLLRYSAERPKSSKIQLHFFPKKKEKEKFQQILQMENIFEEIIYLLDVMDSVYDRTFTKNSIGNVL